LYQTLANIATEKLYHTFHSQKRFCLEKGKQKQKKKEKEKDNTGTIIP
jgi:hypothetical protein